MGSTFNNTPFGMEDIKELIKEIPSLDLADFTSGSAKDKEKFVLDLGRAYEQIGFVAIKNHGLSDDDTKRLYQAIQEFFELPQEIKDKYDGSSVNGQRGYTSKGKEHAKGRKVGDLKEFYHVGQPVQDIPSNDPIKNQIVENIFPEEIPDFEPITLKVYNTLEEAGKTMLRAIALYLELEEDYFDSVVKNADSILRPIHYPPIENPEEIPDGAVRAAAHGDINFITLLMGASADGLEVLRRDGKWIPITALPDQIVVNVGDMLDRMTNNKMKSTIHRVVNPTKEKMKESRYSVPFFMHARPETDLSCLESCVSDKYPKMYDDTTAGEFLLERLREIGLAKN